MRLRHILAFRLVSAAPERLARFYAAIGFSVGETTPIPAAEMARLGLSGAGSRLALTLGAQRVDLDGFDRSGRPYPDDTGGNALAFQHLALVTDDAAAAWARAQAAGATPISRDGAVTLPASAGGVTAAKLRDPEGHPLEFIQFPDAAARGWPGHGLLGIDHSAISVADTGRSRRFYTGHGLTVGDTSLNHGPTQVALDGLDGVAVEVVPLLPPTPTPHLELLGYRQPPPVSSPPRAPNDIAATRILWAADEDALLRDPDGHLHELSRTLPTP